MSDNDADNNSEHTLVLSSEHVSSGLTGSNTNFTIHLRNSSHGHVTAAQLVYAQIPNAFNNVIEGLNSFTIQDVAPFYGITRTVNITIPPGRYDINDLTTTINAAVNYAYTQQYVPIYLTGVWTILIAQIVRETSLAYPNSLVTDRRLRLEVLPSNAWNAAATATNSTAEFTITSPTAGRPNDLLTTVMGFTNGQKMTTNFSTLVSTRATSSINVNGPQTIFIRSTCFGEGKAIGPSVGSGEMIDTNIMGIVSLARTIWGECSTHNPEDATINLHRYRHTRSLSRIDFQLTDINGTVLSLPANQHAILAVKLFMKKNF